MKILPYILFVLLFLSCRHSQDRKTSAISDFKYSSYLWQVNQQTHKWEFYLANYFHVDSNGEFKLMRHTVFLDTPQYFSGTLNEFTKQTYDSLLLENKFFPEIKTDRSPDTPFLVYDGFTYLLDYKIVGKDRTKIQYINSSKRTQPNILHLTMLLDLHIAKTYANKIDSFSIGSYVDTLKKISSYYLPLIPEQPQTYDSPLKFVRPKTEH
jgi:hypothetical protein